MSPKEFIGKFNYYYENVNDESLNKGKLARFFLFIDYIFAFIFHGCSITNYFVYGFYGMKHRERKKYVTWRRQKWIYKQCNEDKYGYLLRDKDYINTNFDKYLGRDWKISNKIDWEEFEDFASKNPSFIVKPIHGTEGQGIYKYENLEDGELREVYNRFKMEEYLYETYIKQHPAINAIHPSSVNTLRIATVRNRDGVNIMSASLRMGRHGDVMDNYTTGGLVAAIDLETGIIKVPGIDKMHNSYVLHPETQTQIAGLKLPFWEETKAMVKALGQEVPQIRYTGWDIAITEKGPVLLEGNYRGNFHVQQHSDHVGKYEIYKKAIAKIDDRGNE